MTVTAFLSRLAGVLDAADVPYMLAGSFASSYHGEPRSTQDVDLVIHTDAGGTERLVQFFPSDDYYVDLGAALDAQVFKRQFNVIDMSTGWKADLIFRKSRAFSVGEFERRVEVDMLGTTLWIATPEDVAISKLEWSALSGGSERQLRDVIGVLKSCGDSLDLEYVEHWVQELGLQERWTALKAMQDSAS